jgi:electron transport complex protein RnfG
VSNVDLTISAKDERRPEPSSARLVFTLALAALLSGLALSLVHEATAPIIAANQRAFLEEKAYQVVPGSESLQRFFLIDGAFIPAEQAPADATAPRQEIYAAYGPDDAFLGWAIEHQGSGFQDVIGLLFGYDPARDVVTGMAVLVSRETPGLGDKIYKDADFVANFDELATQPQIVLVKEAADQPNEVHAITGATISSRAVVGIINSALEAWRPLLPPPGEEPPRTTGANEDNLQPTLEGGEDSLP